MRREERVLQPADRVWAPAQAGGTRTVAPRSAASPSPRPPRCWSGTRRRRCLPPDLSPPLSAGLAAFPRPLTALPLTSHCLASTFLCPSRSAVSLMDVQGRVPSRPCTSLPFHYCSTAFPLSFRCLSAAFPLPPTDLSLPFRYAPVDTTPPAGENPVGAPGDGGIEEDAQLLR